MWNQEPTDVFGRRYKDHEKKHPRELKAVLNNLATYVAALERGAKPLQIKFGFIHPEPHGVVAIDQKGGGGSLQQTRLYTFPDVAEKVLHLITLGDKRSQKDDIRYCSQFVALLTKNLRQTLANPNPKASGIR